MTYNEKKSLYESIMKEIAKYVKNALNESVLNEAYKTKSGIVKEIMKKAINISKNNPEQLYILGVVESYLTPSSWKGIYFKNGKAIKGRLRLEELTDECFISDFLYDEEANNTRELFRKNYENTSLFFAKLNDKKKERFLYELDIVFRIRMTKDSVHDLIDDTSEKYWERYKHRPYSDDDARYDKNATRSRLRKEYEKLHNNNNDEPSLRNE